MKKLLILAGLLMLAAYVQADPLQWDIPGGIGSIQLPFQSTEVFGGYDGVLNQAVTGVSLPVLTLGKLANGYRMVDGQVGAAGAWPAERAAVEPYLALGHDVIQDIPSLAQFKSLHLNGFGRYSPQRGGWGAGGTFSWAFAQ